VAIILALAKGADTYLIDEPSAYLDSEQRVITARVLKRFVLNNQKTAFIVEHDFIMATYLADQVIVYEGEPGVKCRANTPQGLVEGPEQILAAHGQDREENQALCLLLVTMKSYQKRFWKTIRKYFC
jgi:ATP-binding cassette subfamily E protein 1